MIRYSYLLSCLVAILSWVNPAHSQQTSECLAPVQLMVPEWNQRTTNFLYPYYENAAQGKIIRPASGCGAIAVAQILAYYQFPTNQAVGRVGAGQLDLPYKTFQGIKFLSKKNYVLQNQNYPVLLDSESYDYSIMSCDVEGTINLEVSKLVFHAALAVKSEILRLKEGFLTGTYWLNEETTASNEDLVSALRTNFGFHSSDPIKRSDLGDEAFKSLIRREIENDRPVILYGVNSRYSTKRGVSHLMVIDGYDPKTGQFHINMGWGTGGYDWPGLGDICYNRLYDLDYITPKPEYNFSDRQEIITGIYPNHLDFDPTKIGAICTPPTNITPAKLSTRSSTLDCPTLIYPAPGADSVQDNIRLIWEDIPEAQDYLVTIKAVQSGRVFYEDYPTYAGLPFFEASEFLPPDETIEVTIKTVDDNGNIQDCGVQSFQTAPDPCNLRIDFFDPICLNPFGTDAYKVEFAFRGLPGHTYDVFLESAEGVIASKGSVTAGFHVLGPIPNGTSVALVIEDESSPFGCSEAVSIIAPSCFACTNPIISSTRTICEETSFSVEVEFAGQSGHLYDLSTSTGGVILSGVGPGKYTLSGFAPASDFILSVTDQTTNDCSDYEFIVGPECMAVETCPAVSIVQTLPQDAWSFYIGGTAKFSWEVAFTDVVCVAGYQLQIDTDPDFIHPINYLEEDGTGTFIPVSTVGTFYWRVRARSLQGEYGPWSSTSSFTVQATAGCTAPSGLFSAGITPTSADLGWDPIPGVENYTVFWGNGSTIDQSRMTPYPYAFLKNLTSNQLYCWYVQYECDGEILSSPTKCFTTLLSGTADVNGDLNITGETLSNTQINTGDQFLVEGSLRWQYTQPGAPGGIIRPKVGFYLSTAPDISEIIQFLGDEEVQMSTTSSQSSGTVVESAARNLWMPVVPEGQYYILWVADYDNKMIETDELNNVEFQGVYVVNTQGCNEPGAHNYDPSATVYDGSCETCTDGIKNGDETGIDCGGQLCAPCTEICAAPAFLQSAFLNPSSIRLSWGTTPAANNYAVYFKKSFASAYQVQYSSGNELILYNLEPATKYCWFVQSLCGDTPVSAKQCFQTPLDCNSLVYPEQGDTDVSNRPVFIWNPRPDVEGYKLRVGTSPGGTDIYNDLIVGNTTTYYPAFLPGGTGIYVSVIPFAEGEDLPACQESVFHTIENLCGFPGSLKAKAITTSSATLYWSSVADVLEYSVRYKAVDSTNWITVSSNLDSIELTGLLPATVYEWQVMAVCGAAPGIWSGLSYFATVDVKAVSYNAFIQRFKPEGRQLAGQKMLQLDDSTFAVLANVTIGTTESGFSVSKFDSEGRMIHSFDLLADGRSNAASDIAAFSDGTMLVGMRTVENRYTLYKLTSEGSVLWSKRFNTVAIANFTIDHSDNIIITYRIKVDGNPRLFVLKYDADGQTVWSQVLSAGSKWQYVYDVTVDKSNNYFVYGGFEYANVATAWVAKISEAGTQQWNRKYTMDGNWDWITDLTFDTNGNLFFVGTVEDNPERTMYFGKMNPEGRLKWARKVSRSAGLGIKIMGENLYMVGYTADPNENYAYKGLLVKTDTSGTLLSRSRFQHDDISVTGSKSTFTDLLRFGNSFFFVCGHDQSRSAMFLLKLNSDFRLLCQESPANPGSVSSVSPGEYVFPVRAVVESVPGLVATTGLTNLAEPIQEKVCVDGCEVVASFYAHPADLKVKHPIRFEFTGANATAYEWYLEGESQPFSTQSFAYRSFDQIGDYKIKLVASDALCSDTSTQTFSIQEVFTPDIMGDLDISNAMVSSAKVLAQTSITIRGNLRWQYTSPGAPGSTIKSSVAFYLSETPDLNQVIRFYGFKNIVLTESGDAGEITVTSPVSESLEVPDLAPGIYYLILQADFYNTYNETNEFNNIEVLAIEVSSPIPGCTDPTAINYDPTANQDDGSCVACNEQNGDDCEDCIIDLELGLAAHYPFNGNALDVSGNGHDGVVSGAVITDDRFGNAEAAYAFDGIDDFITLPAAQTILGSAPEEYAVNVWVNVQADKKACIISDYFTSFGSDEHFGVFLEYKSGSEGNVRAMVRAQEGAQSIAESQNISLGQWRMVSCNFSNISQTMELYIDGILQASTPIDPLVNYFSDNQALVVGVRTLNTIFAPFKGVIDDLRIYNRTLSQEEIQYLLEGVGYISCDAPPPSAGIILSGAYRSAATITSAGQIQSFSIVSFKSEQSIQLTPGFQVKSGGSFYGAIEDCPFSNCVIVESLSLVEQEVRSPVGEIDWLRLEIYPNPFRETINIEYQLSREQAVSIEIYDITGILRQKIIDNKMREKGTHRIQISGGSLSPGMYVVVLRTPDGRLSKKAIQINGL